MRSLPFLLAVISTLLLGSCTQQEWQCRCYDKVQSTHPFSKGLDLGKMSGSEAKEKCKKFGIITDSCRVIAL